MKFDQKELRNPCFLRGVWSHFKTFVTFHDAGWLIGNLMSWLIVIPIYNTEK